MIPQKAERMKIMGMRGSLKFMDETIHTSDNI